MSIVYVTFSVTKLQRPQINDFTVPVTEIDRIEERDEETCWIGLRGNENMIMVFGSAEMVVKEIVTFSPREGSFASRIDLRNTH